MLSRLIHERASAERPLAILEAGCGRRWDIDLGNVEAQITGVDNDAEGLRGRSEEVGDLHAAIVGDLRTVELEPDAFDVVYNSFVLEHMDGAEQALINMTNSLRPGGILILRMPDRNSVYGFATRITPLWVHVLFRKYTQNQTYAGQTGHGPFPTYYDQIVCRRGIRSFCEAQRLTVVSEHGANYFVQRSPLISAGLKAIVSVGRALSLGKLASTHNNLTFVIEKPKDQHSD